MVPLKQASSKTPAPVGYVNSEIVYIAWTNYYQ